MKVNLPGIKIVRRNMRNGVTHEYHYAYRGGPLIWQSSSNFKAGSFEYVRAYVRAHEPKNELEVEDPVDRWFRENS